MVRHLEPTRHFSVALSGRLTVQLTGRRGALGSPGRKVKMATELLTLYLVLTALAALLRQPR